MAKNTGYYVPAHETLLTHGKTVRVARALKVKRHQVAGHLIDLWNWVIKNAPDGNLSGKPYRDISDAAGWTDCDDFTEESDKEAERFVRALIDCNLKEGGKGFLEEYPYDGTLLVHDWEDYGGKLHTKRASEAERAKQNRAKSEPNTDSTRSLSSQSLPSSDSYAYGTCIVPVPSTVPLKERREEEKRLDKTREEDSPISPPLGEMPLDAPADGSSVLAVESNPEQVAMPTGKAPEGGRVSGTLTTRQEQSGNQEQDQPGVTAKRLRKKPGTYCPDDWEPTAAARAEAERKYPHMDIDAEIEAFRNYWIGKGEPMADWQRTWWNDLVRCDKYGYHLKQRTAPTAGRNAPAPPVDNRSERRKQEEADSAAFWARMKASGGSNGNASAAGLMLESSAIPGDPFAEDYLITPARRPSHRAPVIRH